MLHGLTRQASTVPLAIAGMGAGLLAALAVPRLGLLITPELVFAGILPGLVFEAAYHLHWEDLRRSSGPIAFLAVPGVLVSAAIVAAVLAVSTGLRPELAFVVGAMVSATDPAAVVAIFTRLGAPRRLIAIVDAESLLNDGTGLVLFAIAVRAVGGHVAPAEAVAAFVVITTASAIAGIVIGVAAAVVIVRLRDHRAQVAVSIVAAYGAAGAAATLGFSAIIATVVTGVVLGNYGRRMGLQRTTESAFDTVWERISTALTVLVFVLVGLAVGSAGLVSAVGPIAWGVLGVLAARAVVVYVLLGGALRFLRAPGGGPALRGAWLHVLFWAGLRGAVATAAALSLPLDIPERDLLQRITFGIVLVTLVGHGSTARWVAQRSGLTVSH